MNPLSVATLVMAGVTFYVGFYHVFLYVRRRQHRRDLSFALSCMGIGFYDVCCAGLYGVETVDAGVAWQHVQFIALVVTSAAFLWFTAHYTGRTSPRVVGVFISYLLVTALWAGFDRSGLFWDASQPAIKHVSLPFGGAVTYYEGAAGPVTVIQSLLGLVIFGYAAAAGIRQYRDGQRREATPLLIALVLFFLGVFNDSAVSMGLYNFVYTIEYAYTSMILLMAYSLSDELVQAAAVRQRLAESEERLLQAQKMEALGTLAGGIAHDFNNLLSPILGHAELAREQAEPGSEILVDLDEILSAGERASHLTRQLLAVTRKQPPETSAVDLNEVAQEFQPVLRHLVREDIEVDLQLARVPCVIEADPSQMHQVLMNLAVNASDAMPQGGSLRIETTRVALDDDAAQDLEVEPGNYVRLAVTDSGTGMSPETAQRIFDPFFTTKERGRGTGLGLATVRGITARHGGGLAVQSWEGRGTRFEIFLRASGAVPVRRAPTGPVPDARAGEVVMVAEDEHAVRDLTARILRRRGYRVLLPRDPEEALDMVQGHEGPIHLLLTDVIMPRVNGRVLYEKISALRPGIRVVYMSGYAGDVMDLHGVAEEGGHFLQKPFTVYQLARRVRDVLDEA